MEYLLSALGYIVLVLIFTALMGNADYSDEKKAAKPKKEKKKDGDSADQQGDGKDSEDDTSEPGTDNQGGEPEKAK